MKTQFLFIIISIVINNVVFSQISSDMKGSVLTGKVIDASTKKPIEFAGVSLSQTTDSSIIAGVITDAEGKFFMRNLTAGTYFLTVNFVGYNKLNKSVSITEQPAFNQAGTLELVQSADLLDDVEITAEQSYFQNSIDKKVYNVEKDIVASSGNASEALQTIPSVTIDIDGNIALRGNTNVRIWIDGKPTGISGSSLNTILEQIPASSIESIEVVTNPSARYEAEGSAGIINIVMKKNKQVGLNGNVSAGISTSPRYEGSVALNYRSTKINVYSNYTYMNDSRDGWGETFRKTFYDDTTFYNTTESHSQNFNKSNMGRAGIDFYLNEKNTLGFTAMIHNGNSENENESNYDFLNADSISEYKSIRLTDGNMDNLSWNAGVTYKKLFADPKQFLSFDASYSYFNMNDLSNYQETFYDPDFVQMGLPILQNIDRPGYNNDFEAALDYAHPFKNGNKLETGIKYTKELKDNTFNSESFDTISDSFINDVLLSNQFIYDEDVYAAYAIWNSSIKKFGYQIGLRAEQTFTKSDLITTGETFENNYFGLFPSVHVAYKFDEGTELTASYSRRIDRPNSWLLNPFPDYSDPYNLRYGNPFLEPEYENNYEIGFTKYIKKTSFDASVYYSQTLNEISPYIEVDSNGISTMTFENYNQESKYGVEVVARSEFFSWWNVTGSFNFNQTIVDAENLEAGLTNSVFNYNIRIMNFFQLYKTVSFQFTFNYNTPWTFAQGESTPIQYFDAGLKSDFFKNKLTMNLSMSDIFNTRQFGGYSESYNYYSDYFRKRESQIFSVKLTYKFGQQDNKRRSGSQENYDNGGSYEMF